MAGLRITKAQHQSKRRPRLESANLSVGLVDIPLLLRSRSRASLFPQKQILDLKSQAVRQICDEELKSSLTMVEGSRHS